MTSEWGVYLDHPPFESMEFVKAHRSEAVTKVKMQCFYCKV
jgi:hypothetical protein